MGNGNSVNVITYSIDEVQKHNNIDDCWIIIDENVYDVTNFLRFHPHGPIPIVKNSGGDCSFVFHGGHGIKHLKKLQEYMIGRIKIIE